MLHHSLIQRTNALQSCTLHNSLWHKQLLLTLINIFCLFFIAVLRLRMIPRNLKLHVSEAKYTQAGKNRRQRQYMYK